MLAKYGSAKTDTALMYMDTNNVVHSKCSLILLPVKIPKTRNKRGFFSTNRFSWTRNPLQYKGLCVSELRV